MKVFWSLIGILVLAASALLLAPSGDGRAVEVASASDSERESSLSEPAEASPKTADRSANEDAAAGERDAPDQGRVEPTPDTTTAIEAAIDSVSSRAESEPVEQMEGTPEESVKGAASANQRQPRNAAPPGETVPDAGRIEETETAEAPEAAATAGPSEISDAPEVAATKPTQGPSEAPEAEVSDQAEVATAGAETVESAAGDLGGGASEASPDEGDAAPVEKAAIDAVERRDDGSLRIADRWDVSGTGTAGDPYVLDWKVLQSAQRVYRPRKGQEKLPEWADILDGSRVRIEGYTMLPIGGQAQDQLLVMLNQWDGCCIGVPPTPYDAAEVMLDEPLKPSGGAMGHQATSVYGQIEGTFKIDPYLVQGWLLGLYVIEDASFEPLS